MAIEREYVLERRQRVVVSSVKRVRASEFAHRGFDAVRKTELARDHVRGLARAEVVACNERIDLALLQKRDHRLDLLASARGQGLLRPLVDAPEILQGLAVPDEIDMLHGPRTFFRNAR